jgi:hypothetical protein
VLLGVSCSTWLCPWLVDATMGAINGDDEDLSAVLIVLFVPEPLNLAAKHKSVRNSPNISCDLELVGTYFVGLESSG